MGEVEAWGLFWIFQKLCVKWCNRMPSVVQIVETHQYINIGEIFAIFGQLYVGTWLVLNRLCVVLWCRCVGCCMRDGGDQCRLQCVSVRAVTDAEKRALNSLIAASEAAFQQFITTDVEL